MGFAKDHLDNEVQGTTRYWSKSGGHHPTKRPTALKQVLGYPTALAVLEPVTPDSTYVSDFTEAAQDAVGAMAANSSKVTLTYVDGTPSLTADIVAGSLGPADIANRTRRIDLPLGAGAQTAGTGVVGAVLTYPDAETGTWRWHCVLPADYVTGTATLYWQWTTATTTANCLWGTFIGANTTNGTFSGTNVLNTSALYVSNGSANAITLSSLATSSITAGQTSLQVNLTRTGADATDTINASVSLVAIWLEYTADM